jgi:hypothetical protein
MLVNFSIYGIYDHYKEHPGDKTGILHITMYFPPDGDIARIIQKYSRFVILVQQNKRAVGVFQRDIQPLIHAVNKPYVIVSCMDDATFPEEVVSCMDDATFPEEVVVTPDESSGALLRHWFATNCYARPSSGGTPLHVSPIPYGIDYWTLVARTMWANTPMASAHTQDRHLSRLRASTIHFSKRGSATTATAAPPRIYINFQFNMDGNGNSERLLAYNTIPRDLMSIQENPTNRYDTWGAYTQHVFVASPRGNGLDTIRTWEALMLGCIVIVRRLPGECVLEELYHDLPVVIIDHWSSITRDFLDRILSEYAQRTFRYDKLGTSYWIDRIEGALDAD